MNALNAWNGVLTGVAFVPMPDPNHDAAMQNGANNVIFGDDVYGEPFADGVLAITLTAYTTPDNTIVETDVVFNRKINWHSYAGALQPLNSPLAQQPPRTLPPPFSERGVPAVASPEVCGTLDPVTEAAMRLRPRRVLPDATAVSFDQDPVLLTADYSGPVTLRNFLVTGDVETIQFKPVVGDIETWTRTGVREIGTRRLSVFSPSW